MMKDFAALSATIWVGALQAAAIAVSRGCGQENFDPDEEAARITDLAVRIIKQLPRYDGRMGAAVAGAIDEPR